MRLSSFSTIVEDCLKFSVSDLKRAGYFAENSIISGVISWDDSRIHVRVDNIKKIMTLKYVIDNQQHMKYHVPIVERDANIGKGVVRYFVCPATHHPCRILYLYGGVFVSRRAMPGALYRSQTKSKKDRNFPDGWCSDEFMPYKRYGKPYYRGKITPYGRRILRCQSIVSRSEILLGGWLLKMMDR